jgi:glycerol transport system ATP-binding protein
MDAGELLQYGPTAEVFHRPVSLRVAKAFSDPPMNLLAAEVAEGGARLNHGELIAVDLPREATRALTLGIRASALRVQPRPGDVALPGRVELAEISGSDTFVHVHTAVGELVAQLTGVHEFDLGAALTLHVSPTQVYAFDATGALLVAPQRRT